MNTDEYFDYYSTAPDYIDADGNVYNEDDLREFYEDTLNEIYGPVTIGNSEFDPADILRELEPITYRVGLSEHIESLGWDEWSSDHEWNTTDEDEDEYTPVCEYCVTEVTSDEVTISLARHARIMCEGCGNFEV